MVISLHTFLQVALMVTILLLQIAHSAEQDSKENNGDAIYLDRGRIIPEQVDPAFSLRATKDIQQPVDPDFGVKPIKNI